MLGNCSGKGPARFCLGCVSFWFALLAPAISHAEQPLHSATSSAPAAPAPSLEPSSYRLPLALAYLVPISVATVGAFALSSPGYYVTGVVGAGGMIAAPALVHGAYDNGGAASAALLGALASISAGAVVGAGILIASGYEPKDADDGVGRVGSAAILGGLVGAGVGYVAWGTFDVIENARAPGPLPGRGEQAAPIRSAVPALQPLFATDRDGSVGMTGLSVGLAGEF